MTNDPWDLSDALEVPMRVSFTLDDPGGNEADIVECDGDSVEPEKVTNRVVANFAPSKVFDTVEVQGRRMRSFNIWWAGDPTAQ